MDEEIARGTKVSLADETEIDLTHGIYQIITPDRQTRTRNSRFSLHFRGVIIEFLRYKLRMAPYEEEFDALH